MSAVDSVTVDKTPTDLIYAFVDRLTRANPDLKLAVILVGSVARNAATSQSDLDLLVIGEKEAVIERTADRIHVQFLLAADFLKRLREGDDFAAWCVRFGVPIVRAESWDRIAHSAEAKTWPDWRLKIEHATRRLLLANDLTRMGDDEAAAEELTYAVSHVGRALLLQKAVFPLSRPEMITQLSDAGHLRLSKLLEDLSFRKADRDAMRQTIRYVKKLLVFLDRAAFKKYVNSRKEARARKATRLTGKRAHSG